jgi:hypothetical protein
MKVGKILSIVIVSVASLIVIAAVVAAISIFGFSRVRNQQNIAPSEGPQAVSPSEGIVLLSKKSGNSSFLYRKDLASGKAERLTSAGHGIESEASFSHNGELVVYSFAEAPDSKSSVWVVGKDGINPHPITGKDEDAVHPVFSPNDAEVFYAISGYTGNHSPIVSPARHDWDVFSVPLQIDATNNNTSRTQITHESFYDLQSLDVVDDPLNKGGAKLLISTTGYPIGALIEEYNLGASGRNKIFQPHVPGESSTGASYGEARFANNGMDILFLGATDTPNGNYDYNVYSMSDVTGGELKQLSHLKGMSEQLKALPGGKATFVNGDTAYLLDITTQTAKAIQ